MRIVKTHSHLNGLEYLIVHKPALWQEIQHIIAQVHAPSHRTKVSREQRSMGTVFYSPRDLNAALKAGFEHHGWSESRTSYWVTADSKLIRKTMHLSPDQQKEEILQAGEQPIYSYNQTDFEKDRVAVEVQFGKYAFVAYDLFVKHMAFFVGDVIDLGIEILPMKSLQAEMSSGPAYYEGELYNLLRQGRSTPAVPLVLIGIAP